jgi:hypothetical protein
MGRAVSFAASSVIARYEIKTLSTTHDGRAIKLFKFHISSTKQFLYIVSNVIYCSLPDMVTSAM